MAISPIEQLSRNRSISTGASELPEHEHKRPRLDTAAETVSEPLKEPMSAVTEQLRSRTISPAPQSEHTLQPQTPPPSSGIMEHHASVVSPTSKMTINTRPLSAQSATHEVLSISSRDGSDATNQALNDSTSKSGSPVIVNVSDTESSKARGNDANEPISVSSSPSEVLIEVGEPEDIEDMVDNTNWSTISGELGVNHKPVSIWRDFPYRRSGTKVEIATTLAQASEIFEKSSDGQYTEVLQSITKWMEDIQPLLSCHSWETAQEEIDLYQHLPQLMIGLVRRRAAIPLSTKEEDILRFIKAFAHTTIHVLRLDMQRYKLFEEATSPTAITRTITQEYLRCVVLLLAPVNGCNLYANLRSHRHIQEKDFTTKVALILLEFEPEKIFQALLSGLQELPRAVSANSPDRSLTIVIVYQYRVVLHAISLYKLQIEIEQKELIKKATFQFVAKADEALQEAIKKQHSWLTIENNGQCLETFCRLASTTVSWFPELGKSMFAMARVDCPTVEAAERTDLAVQAFRLSFLRILVQQGRMELRVSGIELMATTLVQTWTQTQALPPHRRQPTLDLVVQFLRNNEMVRYILGVDSHPQILQRSSNVIGFLCVSNRWETSDSDIAWQAVLESQDHRSVAAVIENLKQNLMHLNLQALLYLHQKLFDLPFEKLDMRTLQFILDLISMILTKTNATENQEYRVNAKTVGLCSHILREANVPSRCTTEIADQTRNHLYELMVQGRSNASAFRLMELSESERDALLTTICTDVQSHGDHATGSIIVMRAFLASLDELPAAGIAASTGFAKLLLDDMACLPKQLGSIADQSEKLLEIAYHIRLACMLTLIVRIPEVLNETLCEHFWTHVLTSTLSHAVQSRAWSTLAEAYRKVDKANSFLNFVSSQLMDNLPVEFLDRAVLEFAQESVNFEIRHNFESVHDSDECLRLSSMERVWRVLLETNNKDVVHEASEYIIHTYLDSPAVTEKSMQGIERTHAELVDRCIQTVIQSAEHFKSGAAFHSKTSLLSSGTAFIDDTMTRHETRLHRSLTLLRKLLNGLKIRPRYRPAASESLGPVLKTFSRKGEPTEVFVRVNNHPQIRNDQVSMMIGQENTGHELWQFLVDVTGWSQLNIIKGGARLQVQDNEANIKDLKDFVSKPGPITISKALGSIDTGTSRAIRASSPVNSKIMHHFGELYALLDSHDNIAKAIHDFLTIFSSQESVVADIKSMTLSSDSLLPVGKPFKLLYFATALRTCIEEESFSLSPNADFLQYAVRTMIATLQRIQEANIEHTLCITILRGIIETLQLAMRAKVPESISKSYFVDHKSFVHHFLQLWALVQSVGNHTIDQAILRNLNRDFFDVILEASLHENDLWKHIDQEQNFSQLFAHSILFNTDTDSRQYIQGIIARVSGVVPAKASVKATDARNPRGRFSSSTISHCMKQLWLYLGPLVKQACSNPSMCKEVLEGSAAVFGDVSKTFTEDELVTCFHEFRTLLLTQHNPVQDIYCLNEYLPYGLGRLLSQCVRAMSMLEYALPESGEFVRRIYQQFLFPPLSDAEKACLKQQHVPLVNIDARAALYDLTIALCSSPQTMSIVAEEMEDGAIDNEAFAFQTANEKKALRSDQGYAGLRNLSNTCYLNSLFCQLFMNIKFRELVINVNIVDENKQKLVFELANVFANMQSSFERYINPEDVVDSITQYTGEPIDVNVQMDVDEFFNLLFDRLEAQLIDGDARESFKSMYGGQLVQQIKSKECEHVSERLEPFSAVQIEIRGKAGLEEGLAAYVEGEVLQGENKYSCTSCGRHVDAVKRACLKEVPNNLIFNLKRFDYDIMTGMRCKVNDEFQFPEAVDMMPYTAGALSSPETQPPPDMFELVGVIIHSGTAETGHYYSFVRQRPSPRDSKDSWVQFNDHEVTKFNPEQMNDQAFGGSDQSFSSMSKFYNGYMLFYQRTASIKQYSQAYQVVTSLPTVTVTLPQELDNRIAQENEICLRRYVAQDPSHAKFVRQITERMRAGKDSCSDRHDLEDKVMSIVLEYVQQVSSRWKELPDFEETIEILSKYSRTCTRCSLNVVEWFAGNESIIVNILRAWYPVARKQFGSLLATSYLVLASQQQLETQGKVSSNPIGRARKALKDCLMQIVNNWQALQRFHRGWDQLFLFLTSIVDYCPQEAIEMIQLDYLTKVLEIVWVHAGPGAKGTPRSVRQNYNLYYANREKNRPFNHTMAMEFFADLLPYVNLGQRSMVKEPSLDASDQEHELLGSKGGSFDWLRRLVGIGTNARAAIKVVAELCNYPDLLEKTALLLRDGLIETPQYVVAARFIEPCFTFVRCCPEKTLTARMIRDSLAAIAETDGYHGGEYLDYVKSLLSLDDVESSLGQQGIRTIVFAAIEHWAPALLMSPNDIHRDVRNETLMLLEQILLTRVGNQTIEEVRERASDMRTVRKLTRGCAVFATKNFLDTQRSQKSHHILSSGQASQVIRVMDVCKNHLEEDNADDEVQASEIQSVIDDLQQLEQQIDITDLENWQDQGSSDQLSEMESYNEGTSPP